MRCVIAHGHDRDQINRAALLQMQMRSEFYAGDSRGFQTIAEINSRLVVFV